MSRQFTILVIADPDPNKTRTLHQAKLAAEDLGARLVIVGFEPADDSVVDFGSRLAETVARELGTFDDYELAIESCDDMAARIVERCASGDIDLIIKQGHRSESVFYSPTDWHLIRDTKTPLLLLDSGKAHRKLETIMATADVEEDSPEQRALDRKVLDYSAEIAERFGSALHVAVCVKTSQVLSDLDLVDLHKREHAHAPKVREIIASDYQDYGIKGENWHVHAGAPEKILAGMAQGLKADLVVLGSVGRKKLQGLLLGNTAEKILRNLHTNVLVIKPD